MLNEELKAFIDEELKQAKKFAKNAEQVYNYRCIAFGAILFCETYKLIDWNDIIAYWDKDDTGKWYEFQRLAYERG